MMSKPDFIELGRIEEELLRARLRAVRSSVGHAGEKGRSLEFEVRQLLREFLPAEYGLATGFVVWLSPDGPQLSPQIDIIIYDAIRFGPLIRLGTSDVFPLEAVYAYIEVKASLRSSNAIELPNNSIEACIEQNLKIRRMDERTFFAPTQGSPPTVDLMKFDWLSLRSYIFAFEAAGDVAKDQKALAARVSKKLKDVGAPAHLHGIYIVDQGFLYTRPVDVRTAENDDYFHVRFTEDHAFLAFKTSLVQALATFPRPESYWIPAIDRYYEYVSHWREEPPVI